MVRRCLTALSLTAVLVLWSSSAFATPDPEFPPHVIAVLASVDTGGTSMPAKYSGKVDATYVCDGDNDEVQIQAAIDKAAEIGEGGTVLLVGGKFYVEDTINLAKVGRLTLKGLNGSSSTSYDTFTVAANLLSATSVLQDNATVLIWKGSSGGTMFELENSNKCTLENLLLFGKDGAQSNMAGKLIHVTWSTGFGSGAHRIINVYLESATEGLVFGENWNDGTCSDSYVEHLCLGNLTRGVVLKTQQSLAHTFVDVKADSCSTAVFYVENGGNIAIYGGGATGTTGAFMEIVQGGANTKPILISGVRIESRVLLKGSASGAQMINLQSCAVTCGSPNNSEYAIDIGRGLHVLAQGCNFTGKIAKLSSSYDNTPATLILDACDVPAPSDGKWSNLIDLDSTEYCALKVRDCMNWGGIPVAYNALTWPMSSEPVIVWSDPVNARNTGTVSLEIYGKGGDGKDTVFFPIEVGVQPVTIPAVVELSGPPSVSWGWPGDNDGLHTSVVMIDAWSTYNIERHTDLPGTADANLARTDSFNASVTGSASCESEGPFYIRFYWKGYVMTKP